MALGGSKFETKTLSFSPKHPQVLDPKITYIWEVLSPENAADFWLTHLPVQDYLTYHFSGQPMITTPSPPAFITFDAAELVINHFVAWSVWGEKSFRIQVKITGPLGHWSLGQWKLIIFTGSKLILLTAGVGIKWSCNMPIGTRYSKQRNCRKLHL